MIASANNDTSQTLKHRLLAGASVAVIALASAAGRVELAGKFEPPQSEQRIHRHRGTGQVGCHAQLFLESGYRG